MTLFKKIRVITNLTGICGVLATSHAATGLSFEGKVYRTVFGPRQEIEAKYTNSFHIQMGQMGYERSSLHAEFGEGWYEHYVYDKPFWYGCLVAPARHNPETKKPLPNAAIIRPSFQPRDASCSSRFMWLSLLNKINYAKVLEEGFVAPWASASSIGANSCVFIPTWDEGTGQLKAADIVWSEEKWLKEKAAKKENADPPHKDGDVVGRIILEDWSTFDGMRHPKKVELKRFALAASGKYVTREHYIGVIERVSLSTPISLPSIEHGAFSVIDFRYSDPAREYLNVRYLLNKETWKPKDDPGLLAAAEHARSQYASYVRQLSRRHPDEQPVESSRGLVFGLLIAILALPPLVYILIKRMSAEIEQTQLLP